MPLQAARAGEKGVVGGPHGRVTAYGTFLDPGGGRSAENESGKTRARSTSNATTATADEEETHTPQQPEEEKAGDGSSLPLLHPESPATAWWRKLFFEVFDKKMLHSELDASQVWDLSAEHTSAEASAEFREVYTRYRRRGCSLKHAIWYTHAWKLAACWALQFASLLCDACTPVLLYALLAMAISGEYEQSQIYALLALLYVSALGEILLHCHSHFLGFKTNLKITGALRALVFENTISQAAYASDDGFGGKKRMAEMAHLYDEDVVNVGRMVTHMQFLWRSVLQIVFELFILVQVIGISFQSIAVAFLSMAALLMGLSRVGNRVRRKLQKKVEERLNVIHECFKGIQMVKLNAWEDKMQEKIERARDEENRERRKVNFVAALQYCLGVDSPNLASVFIFGWVAMQDISAMSPARVFPALLLLRRIKSHFYHIVRLFDVVSKGQASYCKIDCYLSTCHARACEQAKKDHQRRSQPILTGGAGPNAPEMVVAMERACFGQSVEPGKALLLNVSFHARRGQLAMIQGEAGAGKSTLLNAVLGDINCLFGDVFVAEDCRLAYCAQEPWLQTLSIRDNVLFGSAFDYKKYWCVIEACCLTDDLRMLPEGDDTKVGPKGINLSGGQKARVALARACYADADIYLLDCPFASVDAIVQNEIFTKCIVELLRFKTVLMVTHNPELSSSGFVDHVIRVEDLTVHVESAEKGWAVGRHPSRRVDTRNSLPPWRHEDKSVTATTGAPQRRGLALWEPATPPLSCSTLSIKLSALKTVPEVGNTQVPVTSECVGTKVAKKFQWKKEWFSIKTWKVLLKGGNCLRFHVPAKFFLLLYAFAGTMKDVYLMGWSNRAVHGDVSANDVMDDMKHSANVYAVLVISSIVSGFASSVLHAQALSVSANLMFHDMTVALLRAPMKFFYTTPVGELFNRYF
ncbi:hypothetical protein BBJ28_00025043, partial [Nothophytophthora sp. Chile5]